MSPSEEAGAIGDGANAAPEQPRPTERTIRRGCFVAFAILVPAWTGFVVVVGSGVAKGVESRFFGEALATGALALSVAFAAYLALARRRGLGATTALAAILLLLGAGVFVALPLLLRERELYNEAPPIGALRTITTAQALFREGDKDKDTTLDYATSLGQLADAKLIDRVLGSGTKRGYAFRIIQADELTWSAVADPVTPGKSGDRYFFVDESGVIRFSTTGTATSASTAIGG